MAGRPLKFTSLDDLKARIDSYFDTTPKDEMTITGLALHLDCSRDTICEYEKKDEFSDTIKKAKDRIEYFYELRGLKVGNAFDIFRLKNMGWKDRQDHELTGKDGKDLPSPILNNVFCNDGNQKNSIPQVQNPGGAGGNIGQQNSVDHLMADQSGTV